MTADEFLHKMLDDKAFLAAVVQSIQGDYPKKKKDLCEALARAATSMGYDFSVQQIEDGLSRLWLMRSVFTGSRLRIVMRKAWEKVRTEG